jgi:DHA1 family bicyclomycin/chloramphenicol resistance-like MFS transporter
MRENYPITRGFVVVLGLLTALVAFALDISLPAIPLMVRDLATTMSAGQQVVGLFMTGMALGQVPFGLVSDRIGRLPVLYFGIGLFTVAGFVTAISDDIGIMLVARFIQGIGSAAGMVLARAMVRDVSSGAESARLMSVMVMVFTAAPMLAPMFGSLLVSVMGWRLPFAATAVAGLLLLVSMSVWLRETLVRRPRPPMLRQLSSSLREFFAHRQSIYGVLVIMATMVGIMAVISGSSALIIEIYGQPVEYFGFIFALTGLSILGGSVINRRLLARFDALQMIGAGATIALVAGAQMLLMLWLGEPPFWWIWGTVCLYMGGTAFLLPNATALALDPVPEIAGVAASIIGTIQSLSGATSAVISSALYTGTILNLSLVLGAAGVSVFMLFLLRRIILGNLPVHRDAS